jgi:hypothetical protein
MLTEVTTKYKGGFSHEMAVQWSYLQFFQRSYPFILSFVEVIREAEGFRFGIDLLSELVCSHFKALFIDRTNLKYHKRN